MEADTARATRDVIRVYMTTLDIISTLYCLALVIVTIATKGERKRKKKKKKKGEEEKGIIPQSDVCIRI